MKLASGIDIVFDPLCKLIWAQIAQDMKLASGIDIIFDCSCKFILAQIAQENKECSNQKRGRYLKTSKIQIDEIILSFFVEFVGFYFYNKILI